MSNDTGMVSTDLQIRETCKFVGSYQHEDDWRSVGSFRTLRCEELPMSDDEKHDICEPKTVLNYVLIDADKDVSDADITRALEDTNTKQGCHHEHDCCGCRSYSVSEVKRLTGDLWTFQVSSSRNF